MTKHDKRQIWTLLIGGGATIGTAVLGMFSSPPSSWQAATANPVRWYLVFACTIPLTIALLTLKVSLLLKGISDKEELIRDIARRVPRLSVVTVFESSFEAMGHLIENVGRCRKMYNTRFGPKDVEDSDAVNTRVTKRLDEEILKSVKNGMDYYWLITKDYQRSADDLMVSREKYATRTGRAGGLAVWKLSDVSIPLIHFCVLEYPDSKELLFGWALTHRHDFAERVFLIRDERVVEYFATLFDIYKQRATPIDPASGSVSCEPLGAGRHKRE